jgi:hypothetical protein
MTPASAVRGLRVTLETVADCGLALRFDLDADPGSVVFPCESPARFTDGLWRHTCFEAFIGASGGAYREFNFSPSTEFAIYDFAGYRDGMRPLLWGEAPTIAADARDLTIRIGVPATLLMFDGSGAIHLGIAAVIEQPGGALSYWALHHPAAKPDFHDRGGFIVSWPP